MKKLRLENILGKSFIVENIKFVTWCPAETGGAAMAEIPNIVSIELDYGSLRVLLNRANFSKLIKFAELHGLYVRNQLMW